MWPGSLYQKDPKSLTRENRELNRGHSSDSYTELGSRLRAGLCAACGCVLGKGSVWTQYHLVVMGFECSREIREAFTDLGAQSHHGSEALPLCSSVGTDGTAGDVSET